MLIKILDFISSLKIKEINFPPSKFYVDKSTPWL